MRVIAGTARGHKLQTPEGLDTRPTTDRIKETLFNILSPRLAGCRFLDLFSGSGGNGIEALSRGAARAVFVDKAAVCKDVISANLKHTKLEERAEVLKADVGGAIDTLAQRGETFDIIFMDPPYAGGFLEETLAHIVSAGILQKDGLIVAERSTKDAPPCVKGLCIAREKVYKTTTMTFLTLEGEEA